jgi:CRISPR-associated endonuclease/helicase Cas3
MDGPPSVLLRLRGWCGIAPPEGTRLVLVEIDIHASLARYWGKAHPDVTGGPDHHTVLGHSLDVAACAFVLVDRHPVLRRQLGASAQIPCELAAITCAAVCALHDVGKLDTRFQRKAPRVADVLRPASSVVTEDRYDHGTEGFRQVEADDAASSLLQELLGTGATALLRAVCGHHGALPSPDEPASSYMSVGRALRAEDAAMRRAFIELVVAFFVAQGARLPWPGPTDGAVVQRLAGLCTVADWLGSNVEHFKYASGPVDIASYWTEACRRAVIACDDAGLLRGAPRIVEFSGLFPTYTPRDVQILTEAIHLGEPALVIVEAEMGKGKTEAALSMAARFLGGGFGDGVTFALPTMATSNAMFARIHEVVPRLFAGDEVQLALAHGRASREPRFQRLVPRSLKAHDQDAAEASVLCARWLRSKKRVLLAQVGVGTVDQALQAALVLRHQFVRMFSLSRNVVVIDEVHAYDAYMEVLLEHLLRWLGALGVPVILLSATLPSERRAALAQAWRGDVDDVVAPDDLACARARPYPLVSVTTPRGTELHPPPETYRRVTRTLALERSMGAVDDDHLGRIAQRLVDAARKGARVVWIRNTVREAQRAFGAVAARAEGVEHTLFHARFRGCDRAVVEQAVLADFGKDARPGGRVLVATQVVEQSLDLDFDEMHTDLAPIDLLFQRAGRLHRHDRARPPGFEAPRLVVYVPSDTDIAALSFGPSRYVYDAGTLWLADRALRNRSELHLPDDIRPLVEETYHPASREALLPLGGGALVAEERKRAYELTAKRTKARQCCIPSTSADPDGGSALPDDDGAVQAFTRDGSSATLLPLWWNGTEARALDRAEDTDAWHLDPKAPDAWHLAGHLLDQTLSLPARTEVEGVPVGGASAAWVSWMARFTRFAEDSGLGANVVPLPMRRDRDGYKGWLRVGKRRRRVLYTQTLGLLMPTEKGEKQQR